MPAPHKINWNDFVKRDAPRIYRYFSARFTLETSDDLTQEVLMRLVAKVESDQFSPAKGSLIRYAFGIAHFVAQENLKRRQNEVKKYSPEIVLENLEDDQNLTQEDHFLKDEDFRKLKLAITQLSSVEQDIISLLIDRDTSLLDISNIVCLPLNTVKSHIRRSKFKLKAILSG